jgi:rhamnosyltransferase
MKQKSVNKFSIIVPTRNAGSFFDGLLNSLNNQSIKPYEIIIIDSSSTDSTISTAKKYSAKIQTIYPSEFDHGGTRNIGASLATGDIFVFITQDILPVNSSLLEEFDKIYEDPSIGGAYARQMPRIGADPVEALSRRFSYPDENRINTYEDLLTKGVKALYFANPCASVRRTVFEQVGGFSNKIICNEDMIIAYKILKAGYKTFYASKAIVYHSHNYSPVQLFKRYFDIGCFFKSYPELQYKAKNTEEGISQTIKSIKALISEKQGLWVIKIIIDIVFKLFGYRTGQLYKHIPYKMRSSLSMNKNFWKEKDV